MKRHLRGLLIILAATAPALANAPSGSPSGSVGTAERIRLHEASDASLGTMRAGDDQGTKAIPEAERSSLRTAEAKSPGLGAMRGGLDTVEVLLIVVLVLVILVLI